MDPKPPLEAVEMRIVASFLDQLGVLWCHPANEGLRTARYGAALKAQGLKRGVPDILVFEDWRKSPSVKTHSGTGIAIELKRKGIKIAPTEYQTQWLSDLAERGWLTAVCAGADAAIELVQQHVWYRGNRWEDAAGRPLK